METSKERRQLCLSFPKTGQSVVCICRRRFVLLLSIICINKNAESNNKKGLDTLYNMRYNKEEDKSYIGVICRI